MQWGDLADLAQVGVAINIGLSVVQQFRSWLHGKVENRVQRGLRPLRAKIAKLLPDSKHAEQLPLLDEIEGIETWFKGMSSPVPVWTPCADPVGS